MCTWLERESGKEKGGCPYYKLATVGCSDPVSEKISTDSPAGQDVEKLCKKS